MIDILIITPEITKGMKSVGSKCLLPLRKNLSVIEYQIAQAQKITKQSHITINIGFDSEKIISKLYRYRTIRYLVNHDYNNTNQAKNLLLYIDQYKPKNLLILSSGLLLKENTIEKTHLQAECKIFMLHKHKNNFSIGSSMSKNLEYLFFDMDEPWTEIVYLNEDAINILSTCDRNIFKQMYLFEVINFLLSKNIKFTKVYINKGSIMKINNYKDLDKAKVFI
jgi:hypothetical protein